MSVDIVYSLTYIHVYTCAVPSVYVHSDPVVAVNLMSQDQLYVYTSCEPLKIILGA